MTAPLPRHYMVAAPPSPALLRFLRCQVARRHVSPTPTARDRAARPALRVLRDRCVVRLTRPPHLASTIRSHHGARCFHCASTTPPPPPRGVRSIHHRTAPSTVGSAPLRASTPTTPLSALSHRGFASRATDLWRRWSLHRARRQQQKALEHAGGLATGPDRIGGGLQPGDLAGEGAASSAAAYAPLGAFLGDEGVASFVGRGVGGGEGSAASASAAASVLRKGPSRAKELKLRCTEFNARGAVTLVSGEFQKQELIAKYGLLPRDLRKIDSSILPHILVRPSAILLNLLHLRVLIMHDRVLVFDAFGSTNSFSQSVFIYDLEHRLAQRGENGGTTTSAPAPLPYELRALEAVLVSVTNGLEHEFEGVRTPVGQVLRALEEDIDRDTLRHLLVWSKKLGTFEQKARLVRDALEELLEADDDLAAMYLTAKATGPARPETDHTEVEMLLESYHKVADEIVQAAENLVSSIRNTEEIVRAILDANRNSLMLLELKFSIGTLGLGAGTFVAALYGMNLKNFLEDSDLGFWGISGACAAFTALVCAASLRKLRRVQRLSMWGEHHGGSAAPRLSRRGSWRDLGRLPAPPDEVRASGVGPGTAAAGVLGMEGEAERGGAVGTAREKEALLGRKLRPVRW